MDKIKVIITNKQKDVKIPTGLRMLIRRCCNAVLKMEKFEGSVEVSVTLVNNKQIRELNSIYRNIDRVTDVLSFPMGENGKYDTDPTNGAKILGDIAISLLYGYKRILAVLIASEWFPKHGKNNDPQSGLLLEGNGDDIVIRRVSGKQRPDMICGGDEWQLGFWRPYDQDNEYEDIPVSEYIGLDAIKSLDRDPAEILKNKLTGDNAVTVLEAETAQGNPQAMKLLAARYAKGDGVSKDLKQALSLYEKAHMLLPDDADMEFEIFMLKMEIDDQ